MPSITTRNWTPKATASLFELTRQGYSQREIATKLRRTPKAIERKVAKIRHGIASLPFNTFVRVIDPVVMNELINE